LLVKQTKGRASAKSRNKIEIRKGGLSAESSVRKTLTERGTGSINASGNEREGQTRRKHRLGERLPELRFKKNEGETDEGE